MWAFLALMALSERIVQGAVGPPWWLTVAGIAGIGAAVLVARTRPLAGLLISLVLPLGHWVYVAAGGGSYPLGYLVTVLALSYLAGRRSPAVRPALITFAVLAVLELAVPFAADRMITVWVALALVQVFVIMVPWLIGRYRALSVELVRAGWRRAEQLEREHEIVAEGERLRERTRIAEDMHDSLGHELALLAVRAGALQVAPGLAAEHQAAAADLRAGAATATERLRQIIGVLREGAPQRVNEDVAELVDRARSSGLVIEDHGRLEGLPPMAHRAAYRVVQEALTNAAKHAPGTVVTVGLAQSAGETIVTVTNGPPDAPPESGPSSGLGLVGLRERVRMAGGTLDAGPRDGGFLVRARLPHTPDGPAARPPESAQRLARRRTRRGLLIALGVPFAIAACLCFALFSYYVSVTRSSELTPADFERLTIGQPRTAIDLPANQMISAPTGSGPAAPAGSDCEYYRSDANPLGVGDVYRLCFSGDRLAAKDVIPPLARR